MSQVDMTRDEIRQWVEAAMRDGWMPSNWHAEVPPNTDTIMEYAAKRGYVHLEREGWAAMPAVHEGSNHRIPKYHVNMWGPDGLSIRPPIPYKTPNPDLLRYCEYCGANDVDTFRVSFAGRCCANCLPALRAKYEQPGWTR